MPLSPTAPALEQVLQAAIVAGLQQQFGGVVETAYAPYPEEVIVYYTKLATAIAQIATPLIAHLVANTTVNPGQVVIVTGIDGPETGATVAPGTIS